MMYAIGDLHLGLAMNKPMDKFGAEWTSHHLRIEEKWRSMVTPQDTVVLVGDTSWAMDMEDFAPDLQLIQSLPGRKIIVPGNHDYWWGSTNKLNALDENVYFLKCGFAKAEGLHICGARGWLCPNDTLFTEHDRKIYLREAARLKLSLDGAMKDGATDIVVAMHYPPLSDSGEASAFTALMREYPVRLVVYGHLHGEGGHAKRIEGSNDARTVDGIAYKLVSCDYLKFSLWPILL